ncbi:MAG: aromatic ring-hydroxylating dioxygenase subunit alpha [Chloroflexota bacterium]|nr:aromatic ring-hydroxylating dioxygenase subunit alpha [Chloroflexota bacterium]MDE2941304.1 aromatic ring-hydroxylating dioxygenase subunit alpha [Chloroflexota bacterium]MDE3267764.1 aromatic ring-hydroxylating dioxygenase subunit alpha [Chloroflexota bacterium]
MKIEDLVEDDRGRGVFRVHRSSMTSDDLFRLEREHILDRCWIYIGHESEVENPGDYRRRTVAGRPVFLIRSRDGQARVFLNTCTHRGALVCRRDSGNALVFQCFYHAWTFNTYGELIGVPGEDAYGPAFDRKAMGLGQPPRVENYRGFIFVSFNPDAEDLVTYLAGARDYLDMVVDQSSSGMKVIPGTHQYTVRANWKLMVENSLDGYHLVPTHRTYLDYMASLGTDDSGQTLHNRTPATAKSLGNGHCVAEAAARNGRPIAHWHPLFGEDSRDEIAEVRQRLVEAYGESRAYQIADTYRSLLIYPNLIINDLMVATVRYIEPVDARHLEITAWHIVPREEPPKLHSIRLDTFLTFFGPGGFASPDDVEALESCQSGFRATEVEWSDISRGMLKSVPEGTGELQMRGFWRQWHANMQGFSKTNVQDREPADSESAAIR